MSDFQANLVGESVLYDGTMYMVRAVYMVDKKLLLIVQNLGTGELDSVTATKVAIV